MVQARVVSSIGARTPPPNEGLACTTRWPDSVKRQRDGGWAAPAAGRSQDKGEGGGPLPHEYSFFFSRLWSSDFHSGGLLTIFLNDLIFTAYKLGHAT